MGTMTQKHSFYETEFAKSSKLMMDKIRLMMDEVSLYDPYNQSDNSYEVHSALARAHHYIVNWREEFQLHGEKNEN